MVYWYTHLYVTSPGQGSLYSTYALGIVISGHWESILLQMKMYLLLIPQTSIDFRPFLSLLPSSFYLFLFFHSPLSFSLLSNSCLLIWPLSLFFSFYFPLWIPQSICLATTVTASIILTLRAWGQACDSHQTNAALTQ